MTRPLLTCIAGDCVIVGEVQASAARVDRLAAMGIMPGVELRVQQTRPAVIVEFDETVLALEREMASNIIVLATPEAAFGEDR
jgi:Fe2+ transport system protein FeoA